jgi:hypothetical protein
MLSELADHVRENPFDFQANSDLIERLRADKTPIGAATLRGAREQFAKHLPLTEGEKTAVLVHVCVMFHARIDVYRYLDAVDYR